MPATKDNVLMNHLFDAFAELASDEDSPLYDPTAQGYTAAASPVRLERSSFGYLRVCVHLHQIAGEQLEFVLLVARKYDLDVREEGAWLVLSGDAALKEEETS